uniref:Reverse transcriptase domain-containing protein n=1 Tax=Trichuris muris TaxID=70415 RepID=A0A5S6PZV4_TRIMR
MPFVLTGAPATFQRLMELALAGLKWETCFVYLDDVIVFSRTFEEHLERLAQVFLRFRQAGMKISPEKSQFLRKEVTFLGHSLSAARIRPDPRLSESMRSYPTPTCVHELQSFVGLASYYRRFIRRFAEIAAPLHRLTQKGTEFNLFYVSLTFLNRSSWIRTLVVLPSVQYSRKWTKRDANIPSRSRAARCPELSKSIVSLDDEFTLRTDHGSLRWLQSFRDPDGQWARWQEKLQRFRFKIVHRPGKQHSNAEGLSRMTCKQCGRKDEQLVVDEPLAFDPVNATALTAVDDIRLKQKHDPDISELLTAKLANDPALLLNQRTKIVSILAANWDRLCVNDVSRSKRNDITSVGKISFCLHSGTSGRRENSGPRLPTVLLPGYRTDVKHYIKTCWECNTRDDPIPNGRALLQPQTAHYTWQKLAEDIAGPLPTTPRGNRYILIVPDASKFVEAIPMPNQEAELVREVFCRASAVRSDVWAPVPHARRHDKQAARHQTVPEAICRLPKQGPRRLGRSSQEPHVPSGVPAKTSIMTLERSPNASKRPWIGPYVILEKLSAVTYRIQQLRRKDVIHVVHEDRLKHCRSDLRLPPRHNTTRPPRMSAPPAMQQKSWIRTYCDPDANAPRPPELVFLDPMNPLPRQLSSPSASPPAVERSRRHTRKPAWFHDYVTDI